MSHASITVAEGLTMADYLAVGEHLGPDPAEGLISEVAGTNEAGLHVITVWESKADHDRFVAERLVPAFQAAGLRPGPMSLTDVPLGAVYLRSDASVS